MKMRLVAKLTEPARLRRGFSFLAGLIFILLMTYGISLSAETGKHIKVIHIEESITPGTAAFLARGTQQAAEDEAVLIVVHWTPLVVWFPP